MTCAIEVLNQIPGPLLRIPSPLRSQLLHAIRTDPNLIVEKCGSYNLLCVFWRLAQLHQDRGDTDAAEEVLREGLTFAWMFHGQSHELALKAIMCARPPGPV